MYTLRPYQRDAVQATLSYFRKQRDPALIVLPTGAGKSLVIAELARIAKGRVLVLAHVKELVEQNHIKFESYGEAAGIYSAGLERKDSSQKVIFGSIQSVARAPARFFQNFSLLIVDECHRISNDEDTQYLEVIQKLQNDQPHICILGLTATPYRLGLGWIYQYHYQGVLRTDEERFFKKCIYEVTLGYMIKSRYLTQPVKIDSPVASYDFSDLYDHFQGKIFPVNEIESILKDQARVTPAIIANIIDIAADRKGVMIFTSSVRHAKEVLSLLPEGAAALVLGDTAQPDRDKIVTDFKERRIKFLVNVSVLTTGFDAPHVDVIALLRPTESVSLYQQIIGRGLRLYADKEDCLILDYTGVGHHLYRPEIEGSKPVPEADVVEVDCPSCGHSNEFWGVCDETGEVIEHFGQTCRGALEDPDSHAMQKCGYRFRSKSCDICGTENDTSARNCASCGNALVSDSEKLKQARAMKDAHVMRPDSMMVTQTVDKKGMPRLEVRYYDHDGQNLTEYFYLSNQNDAKVFYYNFVRMHHKLPERKLTISSIEEALKNRNHFRIPLYVIARKQNRFWKVREKIFR